MAVEPTSKYIFENGVMKINPNYQKHTTVAQPNEALAITANPNDVMNATNIQFIATGKPMQLTYASVVALQDMQESHFINLFQTNLKLDGSKIIDDLTENFDKYEIPIGMINKLLALRQYRLHFIIDDSPSMQQKTDIKINQASSFMIRNAFSTTKINDSKEFMTRWEEVENRLHIFVDMLAFIPTDIKISFLNSFKEIVLNHNGKSPETFANQAHKEISRLFKKDLSGSKPIHAKLDMALNQNDQTMIYLFTDGAPTDSSIESLQELIVTRSNPKNNPVTFLNCTDQSTDNKWMKDIKECALFVSQASVFNDEKTKVLKTHGCAFPYTKGIWLVCQLIGAINRDELDLADGNLPLSKQTIDNLMGRQLTAQEYKWYFDNNPIAQQKYHHLYNEFIREDIMAKQIIAINQPPQVHPFLALVNMWRRPLLPTTDSNKDSTSKPQYVFKR